MKKHVVTIAFVCLALPAFPQVAEDPAEPSMAFQVPGAYEYQTNNWSVALPLALEPDFPSERVAFDAAVTPAVIDPNLIGFFSGNGGAIYLPFSTHKSTIKANNQYPVTGNPTAFLPASSADEIWLRDSSFLTNRTIASGETSVNRGDQEPVQTFYVYHNIVGRFLNWEVQDDNNDAVESTTIISVDDPLVSSWTGKAIDRPNRNQRTADNAVTIVHQDRLNTRNMGSYRFVEGRYVGGAGYSGLFVQQASAFTIQGASFIGGSEVDAADLTESDKVNGYSGAGAWLENVQSVTINNQTGHANDRFQGGSLAGRVIVNTGNGFFNRNLDFSGGDGLFVWAHVTGNNVGTKPETAVTITGGDFIASQFTGNSERSVTVATVDLQQNTLDSSGGDGVFLNDVGIVAVSGGNYIGGNATSATLGGRDSEVIAQGGSGLGITSAGTVNISGGNYVGGKAGNSRMVPVSVWNPADLTLSQPTEANSIARSQGGTAIVVAGSGATTIANVTATGGQGSNARTVSTSSESAASGGHGLMVYNTAVTINSGSFTGANGGSASGSGVVDASGGAGVYAANLSSTTGSLIINGGTFKGGAGGTVNGQQTWGGAGVWVENTALTINQANTNVATLIDGDVFINNRSGVTRTAAFNGGTITGDIYLFGRGTTTLTVSTNAIYNGSFVQYAGTVNTTLSTPALGKFFSDLYIGDATNNITGKLLTTENARIALGSQRSRLNLSAGLELSEGASIDAGFGQVKVTTGDLILRDNASIAYSFDSLNNVGGLFDVVAGNLVVSNANVKIVAEGISSTPTGSVKVVKSTGVVLGGNTLDDIVDVDFGWLTTRTGATANGGITVDYGYSSLTNTSLKDLDNSLLTMIDGAITNLGTSEFYALNAGGAANGTSMFRYSLSQMPDVSESSFQVSQKVSEQIAARGTEFRSMNGFASTQPRLGQKAPAGAAGPGQDKDMQGWVRAYGAFGNREEDGNFTAYDSDTWGSVIGVDKSFGNLLVGLAGGYARTDIDGGGTYEAEVNTYHGSVYSTIGGESLFLDLAATYARANTEEHNAADPKGSEFDSDVYSGYIGLGKSFDLGEKLSLTPEASLLATYYDQQSYDRAGVGGMGGTVESYDTWSYMGTLGASVSTLHQIDWMNRGLALVPEVRAHWLHDFNADPEDFTFNIAGTPYVFGVRPRDEDLLRLGFGFDIWNWKYQSTKFEIDYDALLADKYYEHILSGKISVRF